MSAALIDMHACLLQAGQTPLQIADDKGNSTTVDLLKRGVPAKLAGKIK